jgi:hypothetical protein
MRLGYKTDDSGHQHIGTSVTATRIRDLDVELFVTINKNVSYPLESSHNKGFHVEVHGKNAELITDFNVNDVATEFELIAAVTDFFTPKDNYVMITSAASGETFHYETEVYNQSAIDNKSYDCWDEDLEQLEDNADQVVAVFLNSELCWQVK